MTHDDLHTPALGLIGYGRMGREIEQTAIERQYTVNAIIDVRGLGPVQALDAAALASVDVCIEFTVPDAAVENIRTIAACGKNLVVGTTGWHDRLDEVRDIVTRHNIGLIYASNFSIGVHLFSRLVTAAATMFAGHPEYQAALTEVHHRLKADSPSGTAVSLAERIVAASPRLRSWTTSADPADTEHALHVSSSRVGSVPGTHRVGFDSPADTIELVHTARSRRGFADGALAAARWIHGRKGLFTIQDMLDDIHQS